jgi:hypothetical protein
MFCLCDRIEDAPYEEVHEQQLKEETQQFDKEGK